MQNTKFKPRKDLLAGIIFFVFGSLMLTLIIPLAVPVSFVPPGQISPRFLPTVLSGAITFTGFLVLLLPMLKKIKPRVDVTQTGEPTADNSVTSADEETASPFLRVAPIFSIAVIIICYLLLIWFGFIISSIFSIVAIMFAFGERKLSTLAITSVVLTALVWLFAVKLLNIPIP